MKQETKVSKPFSLLIYGVPKIGLSSLANSFPDPLFLNLDDHITHLKDVKEIGITCWDDFIRAGAEISDGKHPSGWLIVSHIERLWQFVCDHITAIANGKNGTKAENIADLAYADWRHAIAMFEAKLQKLLSLQNTVLLSHEIAEVRNVRGLERTYFLSNLERKASLVVLNLVDATGRLYSVEQDLRILSFISQENQVTGSRIPELQNRKFVIQGRDISHFINVIKLIESTRRSTTGAINENSRTREKSPKKTVFKRNHPAVN